MKLFFKVFLFLMIAGWGASMALQASDWNTMNTDPNNYNVDVNWDPVGVPGVSDTVSIQNGGTANEAGVNSASTLYVGGQLSGVMNVNSGGTLTLTNAAYLGDEGWGGDVTGTLNLNSGGALVTNYVSLLGNAGTGVVNFNGGTLKATAGASNTNPYNYADLLVGTSNLIGTGGAVIDTNGFYIKVSTPLLAAAGGSGSFTKTGSGDLIFNCSNANSYTGTTIMNGGKLWLANTSGVAVPGNVSFTNGNTTIYVVGDGQIASSAVIDFTNYVAGSPSSKNRTLDFHGTTAQTVGGLISTGTVAIVRICGYDNTNQYPPTVNQNDKFRFTVNTAAGQTYSYRGSIQDNSNAIQSPMLCFVKDGLGEQDLVDRIPGTFGAEIGSAMSGGLEVKDGVLGCTAATLPNCWDISDIAHTDPSTSNPNEGLQTNAGHYTITGGTLKIGTHSAGNPTTTIGTDTHMKGIGQFQITGGTVDADPTNPGTLYSNHDFDIQGGTVNAILAGTGHMQDSYYDYSVTPAVHHAPTPYNQGLTKTQDTIATLGAPNIYTGPTTISGGTLQLSANGQISASSAISTADGATLEILAGIHTVGVITGTGATKVDGSATLTATSIVQDTLTIGSLGGAANTVPEPGTLILLAFAALGLLFAARWRK